MKKSIFALLLVVALVMVMVTGCNSGEAGANGGNKEPDVACICGTTNCDAAGEEHKDVTWEKWTAADSLPAAEAGTKYISLTADVVLPQMYELAADQVLAINLNGHTISIAAEGDNCDRLFALKANSNDGTKLIIADGTGTGKLDYTNCTGNMGLGILQQKGTVDMFGGNITHIDAKAAALGGAGLMMQGGTFNMYGGTFEAGIAGGGKENGGGNIHVKDGATFNMYGGEIVDGTIDTVEHADNPRGGNVALTGGAFNLKGGTVSGGRAIQGGAFCLSGSAELNISGGEITEVMEATSGVICLWDQAVVNMSGGEITGNTSTYKGSAVLLNGHASLVMTGGKIYDNAAKKNSGAVHAQQSSKVIVSGSAQITGDLLGPNVYLDGDTVTIEIGEGGLNTDAVIGVTMKTPGVFIAAGATEANKACFVSDKAELAVTLVGETLKLG